MSQNRKKSIEETIRQLMKQYNDIESGVAKPRFDQKADNWLFDRITACYINKSLNYDYYTKLANCDSPTKIKNFTKEYTYELLYEITQTAKHDYTAAKESVCHFLTGWLDYDGKANLNHIIFKHVVNGQYGITCNNTFGFFNYFENLEHIKFVTYDYKEPVTNHLGKDLLNKFISDARTNATAHIEALKPAIA